MKYKLIKAIDVAGLTFLTPVVRLCYGEEPKKQLGEIGRLIVVPLIAFAIFVALWAAIAPRHKTKSGEVPTPVVVWDAASSIWRFHDREADKEDAYGLSGKTREQKLAIVEKRLSQLEPLETLADRHVKEANAARTKHVTALVAPILEKYESLDAEFAAAQAEREAALKRDAGLLASTDRAARETYLQQVRDHAVKTEAERETLKELKSEETTIRAEKFPQLVNALKAQTRIAEER